MWGLRSRKIAMRPRTSEPTGYWIHFPLLLLQIIKTPCHKKTQISSLTVVETMSPESFCWAAVRVWTGMIPSGGSGGKSVSVPFPASGGCLHSLAHDCFLSLQQPLAFVTISPTSFFDLLGSHTQGPLWLHLGPIQIMQDNLISRSLTPCSSHNFWELVANAFGSDGLVSQSCLTLLQPHGL